MVSISGIRFPNWNALESRAIDAFGVVLAATVVYVFSMGPVLKAVGGPVNAPSSLTYFYRPLNLVMERNGTPAFVLRSYINVCGVRNNPRTGEFVN